MTEKHKLASSASRQISLQEIRNGNAGLNSKRESFLSRVPEPGLWAGFSLNSVEIVDLAYLSAATGHEFALLRGKRKDILFHGTEYHCVFDDELLELLYLGKLALIAHTHPEDGFPVPSDDDRNFLKSIGQRESVIISSITGREVSFTANRFEREL